MQEGEKLSISGFTEMTRNRFERVQNLFAQCCKDNIITNTTNDKQTYILHITYSHYTNSNVVRRRNSPKTLGAKCNNG